MRKTNMENEIFTYQYSAKQNREVECIRNKYLPREESKLERLKKLDRRVQNAGLIESLSVGIVGCLVFGIGMCFGLDIFPGADWLSLLFGGIGTLIMIPAYPVYRRIYCKTKEKLSPEIIQLSDEIINSHN